MKKISRVVLCFLLALCFSACSQPKDIESVDKILMANDKLYYATDESGPMGSAECIDGKILSSTDEDKIPTENGQSNFGAIGNSFTIDDGSGEIMVCVDDEWYWFKSKN